MRNGLGVALSVDAIQVGIVKSFVVYTKAEFDLPA